MIDKALLEKIKKRRERAQVEREKQNNANILKGVSTETINAIRGLQGLPPIGSQQAQAGNDFSADADFESLRDDYALKHRCSKFKAHRYIIKKHPDVHRRYLERHNPHLTS